MSDILLWVDIETTGLNPLNDGILEIGLVATHRNLTAVMPPYSLVVHDGVTDSIHLDSYVLQMHSANHLLQEVNDPSVAVTPGKAKQILRSHIEKLLGVYPETSQVMLAGSSVHFDKRFLDWQYPGLLVGLSHRILDVSVLDEVDRSERPDIWKQRPAHTANHRVLNCIRDSMSLYQYYLDNLISREQH